MTFQLSPICRDRARLSLILSQLGLVYFAFSAFYGKAQSNQGLLLILVALLLGRALDGRSVLKDPLVVTSLAFFAYLCGRAALAALELPDDRQLIWDYTSRWMLLGLFPAAVVAAALRLGRFRPHHLLGLAIAGFFLKIARHVDWQYLAADIELYFTLEHVRPTFGHSVINLPFWALFFLMGLIIYSDDYLRDRSKLLLAGRYALFLVTTGLLCFIIVASKTRSIWLLACLFVPLCLVFRFKELLLTQRKAAAAAVVALVLSSLALIAWKHDFFLNRLTSELGVVEQIVSTDDRDVPESSIGLRYYMYRVFLDEAPSKPLLGWGPGVSKRLLERPTYPGMAEVAHFHNIYVELFLQLGAVGLCLFAAMFAVVIKAVVSVRPTTPAQRKFRLFFFCAGGAFCLTGLINNMLWSSPAPYFLILLCGLAYAPAAGRSLRAAPAFTNGPAD
jgi:O-antigen ligase